MKHANKHPGLGLAIFAVVAVAVLGAGILARLAGLHQMQPTLVEETGDRNTLQGFTLSGYTRFQAENTLTHFTLQSGLLTGETIPEQVRMPENAQLPSAFDDDINIITVAPEEREAVNRQAGFGGNTATSYAKNFWVMREITLPDNTSLRLHIADNTVDMPVEVVSYPNAWSGMDWSATNDYLPETYPTWAEEISTQWKGNWMIGLNKDSVLYEPGIWRVTESLSEEEVEALPLDGTVQYNDNTVNVLCKSTEYGKAELFYVPQELDTILECDTLGDYLGVLYQDTNGAIRFDLVDENATCIQQELILESAGTEISHSQTNTQQPDQLCYILGVQQGRDYRIVLLQMDEAGRLDCLNLPGNLLQDGSQLPGTTVIQRSADGQYVLFVGREENQIRLTRLFQEEETTSYPIGYQLDVYDLNAQKVAYTGLLDTGADRIWGDYIENSNYIYYGLAGELLSLSRDCYTVFPQQAQEG